MVIVSCFIDSAASSATSSSSSVVGPKGDRASVLSSRDDSSHSHSTVHSNENFQVPLTNRNNISVLENQQMFDLIFNQILILSGFSDLFV